MSPKLSTLSKKVPNLFFFGQKSRKYIHTISFILCGTCLFAASYLRDVVFYTKDVGLNVPSEITFNFDLSEIPSSQIYLKRSYRDESGLKLNRAQKTIKTTYEYPGFYKAKLLVDNKTVKTSDVFIKTDGWLATMEVEGDIKYFDKAIVCNGTHLKIPTKFSTKWPEANMIYHYFDQINPISGLFFNFEAELISNDQSNPCRNGMIEIVGSNSNMEIPISFSACTSSTPYLIAGREFFPNSKEIRFLAATGNDYQKFKMSVDNGIAELSINGELKQKLPVTSSMGQIVGFRIHFSGSGEVRNVLLTDTKEVTYAEAF